jgi:hypothetical protein
MGRVGLAWRVHGRMSAVSDTQSFGLRSSFLYGMMCASDYVQLFSREALKPRHILEGLVYRPLVVMVAIKFSVNSTFSLRCDAQSDIGYGNPLNLETI